VSISAWVPSCSWPQAPLANCIGTICWANSTYQLCWPKYLNPLARAQRSMP
jgi:hypothetical protein